ncbi:SDR family oxidoreductase [Rathayibacter rathayi]|uniref:SDR family oxidoreductase n=1 Tax=Rathayibacter rathayi TaxID=33887 RepID=UPI000CE89FEF|nr:SDR family oxidoreductase [Rathayibacter rathayi]PPF20565.1 NAD-dependent dehydratase [Rathayibacter rathayi]PPG69242.1 NAD-dependent dehydratase [Rathayibacter rathayi]PPG74097.1 NAD-dependent dehydratase [Rathayibacter rathayi]PPG86161.1 NAD-dependent dehydratase [Rathayibacter rathayi]PPG90202.1 NAD-dependent dehydratase [Rathayibacter rathayi]
MSLSVLFIGGTGIISAACVREALRVGHDVTVLTRGRTSLRPLPDGVRELQADGRDRDCVTAALGDRSFDAVIDFVAFIPEHVQQDIELFAGRTGQYVFISSASAYQKPPRHLPVTESTPLRNPYWQYSRDKIACEDLLVAEYRASGFPVTIVRPSHTYDRTALPVDGGWTVIDRMRRGQEVVVLGDGTSLWTLTHADDVAVGLVGLLGASAAIGGAFHITGDDTPTWDEIHRCLAAAAGVEPRLVHVASDAIAAADPELGAGIIGDKAHSMVFDTAKIRALVPAYSPSVRFSDGAREIVEWYDADPARQVVDERMNGLFDALIERYRPRPL